MHVKDKNLFWHFNVKSFSFYILWLDERFDVNTERELKCSLKYILFQFLGSNPATHIKLFKILIILPISNTYASIIYWLIDIRFELLSVVAVILLRYLQFPKELSFSFICCSLGKFSFLKSALMVFIML